MTRHKLILEMTREAQVNSCMFKQQHIERVVLHCLYFVIIDVNVGIYNTFRLTPVLPVHMLK